MDKRESIVKYLSAGETVDKIVKDLNVSRATVYNVKCYLRKRGNVLHKPGSGKKPTVAINRLVGVIRSRVARNPIRSMRAMARETGVSEKSIRRAIKKLGAMLVIGQRPC